MHVLIIGAAGMVGRKLAMRLAAGGLVQGEAVTRLSQMDVVTPDDLGLPGERIAGNLTDAGMAERLIGLRADVIYHLAAIVSGEAETDFDKGYNVNLHSVQALIEAVRAVPDYLPRMIFTSSIAVFGAPFPDQIPDDYHLTPRTSYGTQKAIAELLLNDYSRRGILDAVSLRLPTVCVRPGKANLAASGFFSNIIREPLVGQGAVLPVPASVRHWHASPRATVGFLMHAAGLSAADLGPQRAMTMPGLSVTVAEQMEALKRVAGQGAVDLIRHEPDPAIMEIVRNWPQNFAADRAAGLGFVAEQSFDEIIAKHIEDEAL